MVKNTLYIATRKSPLALWQANFIGQLLKSFHPDMTYQLVPMTTTGDRFTKDKLQEIGGKGLFVKELEEALLDRRADIAVHSIKDVPAEFPSGLGIQAICKRDNPFDVLVSNHYQSIDELPTGSIVGTASLRRQAQLLAYRPDLIIKTIRGNVQTRLKKLQEEDFAAIILAAAGLERLGLHHHMQQIIPQHLMLPACGQGALGIECRNDDSLIRTLLSSINDEITALCVRAERHVNLLLGGNCHVPIAVFCIAEPDRQLRLNARILSSDGQRCIEDEQTGSFADVIAIAENCAAGLIEKGAHDLLNQ